MDINHLDINLPLSKSIAARLLILDYIYNRKGERTNLPDCDDSRELSKALRRLQHSAKGDFNLGTGATSLRFFTALAAALPEFEGTVDCSPQLRRRPLAPLVEALRLQGADIRYAEKEGCAPLYIKGERLAGGSMEIDGSVSSQFISALMLISPLCDKPVEISFSGNVVSQPYIDMTAGLIAGYSPDMEIEADWSAAAFCYEFALVFPDTGIRIKKLTDPAKSVQGDAGCKYIYDRIGIETIFNPDGSASLVRNEAKISKLRENSEMLKFDLGDMPDLVPSLSAALTLAGIPFRFDNIAHLQFKESNRLDAIIDNLAKLGYLLHTDGHSLWWNKERGEGAELGKILIDSHDDHRIAMAFAPALRIFNKVRISNPGCVSKSFPAFWDEFKICELWSEH